MTQHTPDAAGHHRGKLPPAAALAGLLVIGGLLLLFTLHLTSDEETTTARPSQPLRALPVLAEQDGPCPTDSAASFETRQPQTCLTVDLDGGITMDELRQATPGINEISGNWVLTIEPLPEDAERFSDLTARAAGQTPPQNRIAIVVGESLVTSPQVGEPIPPGPLEISGFDTRDEVEDLARQLGHQG